MAVDPQDEINGTVPSRHSSEYIEQGNRHKMSRYDDPNLKQANDLYVENVHLQAELAALRPWAEVGKRAVREQWYIDDDSLMVCCDEWRSQGHVPDCPIPSLLAQLDDANGR